MSTSSPKHEETQNSGPETLPTGPLGASSGKSGLAESNIPYPSHVSPGPIRKMTAVIRGSATDEWHPLVNHGFDDLENAADGALTDEGTPANPMAKQWQGWRRGCGMQRQHKPQCPLPPQNDNALAVSRNVGQPQGLPDEHLYRWWRLCGLEPQEHIQHPRDDMRFTSIVLATFFALEIFVNFDCGAIPCTLSRLADEFRLSPTWQGMLGALPYVGLTVASPFAGRIFGQWRAKRVILISMALNAVATLLMVLTLFLPHEIAGSSGDGVTVPNHVPLAAPAAAAGVVSRLIKDEQESVDAGLKPFFRLPDFSFVELTPSAILLLTSRLLIGLTQAPFVIYAPVWVDEFAPPKKTALWMGIMQGAAVVGVTVGYLSAGVLSVYMGLNWRSAIGFQVAFLCLLIGIVSLFPREFVETPGGPGGTKRRNACADDTVGPEAEGNHEEEGTQHQRAALGGGQASTATVVVELSANEPDHRYFNRSTSQQQSNALDDPRPELPSSVARETHRRRSGEPGGTTSDTLGESDNPAVLTSHRGASLALMTTPMYVSPMLTLCALLFVVTGVQFWGTVFFASSLGLTPTVAMLTFAAVAATSPVAGVVMGGVTVDAVGGYKTLSGRKRTLYACTAYAAAAVTFAVIGSFTTNAYLCVASLWFLLCFGAAMLPPLTGIQIDAVAPRLRTLASGMSMFFYNILGYALGAFLPGVVMDLFHGGDVLGLRLVLLWSFFGLLFVSLTALYARHLERQGARAVAISPPRQVSVHPVTESLPSHTSSSSDKVRRSTSSQGFLPVPGGAAWQQLQEHGD